MAKDYKNTLFLPQTSFPMRANLAAREPSFLKFWDDAHVYDKLMAASVHDPLFILHDGPPYANAHIHIGTALNKILKDFILKYKWSRGFRTPYVPGWDTHGLPIELKVLKEEGLDKDSIDPVELRKKCEHYALQFKDVQKEEFMRLGVLGDWENPYITLHPTYEADQLRVFADLVEKDYVYKGRKSIFWCIDCQTALAAAEIEYEDEVSPSIYVAYSIPESEIAPRFAALVGKDVNVVIWTTTPWTLPASLAVAVHPSFDYGFYEAEGTNGKIYLFASGLKDAVARAMELEFSEPLAVCKGAELERMKAAHPFYDREILFVLGDYVTLEDGTGCVHTAPGHGVEDFETGVRYGLEVYNPVDEKGVFVSGTGLVDGLSLADAEKKILAALSESGRLLGTGKITHSYPHCWRCKKPVIFRATDQWFIAVSKFRERALKCIEEEVEWIPSWGKDRIGNMVRDRSDWCVSRQRIWGVPIPAFYCEECGEVVLTPDRVRRVAARVEKEGANIWWSDTPEQLAGELAACPKCGSKKLRKETDIMDVWFDSGSSWAAVLESSSAHKSLRYPAEMYLEGSDQHRGWFQTSLLNSVATRGRAPFKSVLTHGFIVAGDGRKMSKSLGNSIAPEEVIGKFGADILRLWVASSDYRGDIRISQQIIDNLAESYRRIRNTARFLLANLSDFDPHKDRQPYEKLSPVDRYIMAKLAHLYRKVTQGYEEHEFHVPMFLVHQFCDNDLSAFYLDISKDRLYADERDGWPRRAILTTMWDVLNVLVRMMAPVLCFTAEEIWQEMRKIDPSLEESVLLAKWPHVELAPDDTVEPLWNQFMEARAAVLRALEAARAQGIVGHPLEAQIAVALPEKFSSLREEISEADWEMACIVSALEFAPEISPDYAIAYADEETGIKIGVMKSPFEKCPRCWKRRPEVRGGDEGELTPCARCAAVLAAQR